MKFEALKILDFFSGFNPFTEEQALTMWEGNQTRLS